MNRHRSTARPWLLPLTLVLFAPKIAAQVQVWTVDDDGPAHFAELQPAIDAAAAGDLVLVRGGSYSNFAVAGKGLSLVADEGAAVFVRGPAGAVTSTVSGVPLGQRALLRGLRFEPDQVLIGNTLRLANCAGTVWIEDVELRIPPALLFSYQLNQAENCLIEDCAQVVIVDSLLRGATGAPPGFGLEGGSRGLSVRNSEVHLYGCEVLGGNTIVLGGPGRAGADVEGGRLVLRDSSCRGGVGGDGFPLGPGPGPGGPGLDLDAGAQAWSIGSVLLGGPGGQDFLSGTMGPAGAPVVTFGGSTVTQLAAIDVRLQSPAVVRDDQLAEFELEAPPASSAFLLVALATTPVFVEALAEASAVGLAPLVLPVGVVDPAGRLPLAFALPPLPPALPTWSVTLQVAVITQELAFELSDGTVTTVVDDSF
jgi:hypothetical protein